MYSLTSLSTRRWTTRKPIILMDTVSVSLHFSKGLAELLQVIERFRNCTEYPYSVLVCNVMYSII